MAVPILICRCQREVRRIDVLFFIDNEGALAALIRATSSEEDAAFVSHLTHSILLLLEARVWWGWVDSKSSPADALSRIGLDTPKVLSQEWEAKELEETDFPPLAAIGDAFAAARALLDWFAEWGAHHLLPGRHQRLAGP